MATQPCPDIAQTVIRMQSDLEGIFNDLHWLKPGGWVAGDMDTLANTLVTAATASLPGIYCNDVQLLEIVATDLTSLTSERAVVPFPSGTVGTVAGGSTANNVALAMQKITGNRGKGQTGRLFVGPLPESFVTQNEVSTVNAASIKAAFDALVTAVQAWDPIIQPVVLSRFLGVDPVTHKPIPRPAGIGHIQRSFGFTNLFVDSQKDRLPGHKKRKRKP